MHSDLKRAPRGDGRVAWCPIIHLSVMPLRFTHNWIIYLKIKGKHCSQVTFLLVFIFIVVSEIAHTIQERKCLRAIKVCFSSLVEVYMRQNYNACQFLTFRPAMSACFLSWGISYPFLSPITWRIVSKGHCWCLLDNKCSKPTNNHLRFKLLS